MIHVTKFDTMINLCMCVYSIYICVCVCTCTQYTYRWNIDFSRGIYTHLSYQQINNKRHQLYFKKVLEYICNCWVPWNSHRHAQKPPLFESWVSFPLASLLTQEKTCLLTWYSREQIMNTIKMHFPLIEEEIPHLRFHA